MRVKVKPMSVNAAWRGGRRFKTKEYVAYEDMLMYLLPKLTIPPEGKLKLVVVFGFSNRASDVDNGLKPFIDILQKKYHFNDKRIYAIICRKEDVKKGKEYIEFDLSRL